MRTALSLVLLSAGGATALAASPRAVMALQPASLLQRRAAPLMVADLASAAGTDEASVWLQAFGPYIAIASLKAGIALTSDDPAKQASPAGIATWIGLTGGLYACIIYRTIHPVGSETAMVAQSTAAALPACVDALVSGAALG
jgi:hypothetical protein